MRSRVGGGDPGVTGGTFGSIWIETCLTKFGCYSFSEFVTTKFVVIRNEKLQLSSIKVLFKHAKTVLLANSTFPRKLDE